MRLRMCSEQREPIKGTWTLTAAAPKLLLNWSIPDKDPEDEYDCWTRALCATTGLAYDDVNIRIGRQKGKPIGLPCKFQVGGAGFKFTEAKKGTLVSDLPNTLEPGHYILEMYKHVAAYINDAVLDWNIDDDQEMLNTEVFGWWTMEPSVNQTWLANEYPPCCKQSLSSGRARF